MAITGRSDNQHGTPLIILAAGGTGGHVFPAQALAEEMLKRNWRVGFWTDGRGARYATGMPDGTEIETISSASITRGTFLAKIFAPFAIAVGIVSAIFRIRRHAPKVVAGFGGYSAFPTLVAAWLTGTPRFIHEQNGVLGLANKVLAKRVDIVACGAASTSLPPGSKFEHTGNPVREGIHDQADKPYFPANGGPINLLAIGGSQGARMIDHMFPRAMELLPEHIRSRVHIVQQVRNENLDFVRGLYNDLGVKYEVGGFFDDAPERIANSHIVVSRSGASTVAEICVLGRPSVLIPFAAAANDHQTANAKILGEAGAAVVLSERELSPKRLAEEIVSVITDRERAEVMAAAARSCSKRNSTLELARIAEELAGK